MFEGFTRETSDFLWDLTFHNERPWFQEHREQYMRVLHEPFHALAEDTLAEMQRAFPEANFSSLTVTTGTPKGRCSGLNSRLPLSVTGSGSLM